MDQKTGLDIAYTGAPLGHEIRGLDLSQPVSDGLFDEIERTFDRYGVVVISGQHLTPEQHVAFARRFGTLARYPIDTYLLPGFPELFVVSNIVENGRAIGMADAGRVWHTDMHFTATPPRCSLLYALEVPMRDGQPLGDTLFASTSAAYDALPAETKTRIEGLRAINSYAGYVKRRQAKIAGGTPTAQGERAKQAEAFPDVLHPLVRTHPRTGRKCLYVSDEVTCGIDGMPAEAGMRLIEQLLEHMTQPQFVYRHRWRVGDLVIWDNCSAIHNAIGDYTAAERRRMHRATVSGGPTF